ncbi:MAG: hypothetical protein FRX49_11493 [Trebouxia sp. A1-2]|nr:MAG: hypothetical protein FRX49_11493 [Trebouxia sp. A1-2]
MEQNMMSNIRPQQLYMDLLALWAAAVDHMRMRALEGTQPTLRQSPPIRCSSIIATLAPTPAAPAAVTNPPAPAPITTRLYLHHEVPVCGKHEGKWPDLLFLYLSSHDFGQ